MIILCDCTVRAHKSIPNEDFRRGLYIGNLHRYNDKLQSKILLLWKLNIYIVLKKRGMVVLECS